VKVYVRSFRPLDLKPGGIECEIFYTTQPEWKITTLWYAETKCGILHGLRCGVGSHLCQFSVEELDSGRYAIVCESHPA
jgi:hypothetical protein